MQKQVVNFPNILELPIFPLPNTVLFPRTALPLHIFEPRYKQMVSDALEGDRQIGMALLQPGWERGYHENPDVFAKGGMGIISRHEALEEGKYNIVLTGRFRYKIINFVRETPYRVARVQLLNDQLPDDREAQIIGTELMLCFRELTDHVVNPDFDLDTLEKLDFSTLVNRICSSLNLNVYDKQQLLEMDSLGSRAEAVLAILSTQVNRKRFTSKFRHLKPEDPSVN